MNPLKPGKNIAIMAIYLVCVYFAQVLITDSSRRLLLLQVEMVPPAAPHQILLLNPAFQHKKRYSNNCTCKYCPYHHIFGITLMLFNGPIFLTCNAKIEVLNGNEVLLTFTV